MLTKFLHKNKYNKVYYNSSDVFDDILHRNLDNLKLIENFKCRNDDDLTPFLYACYRGDIEIMKLLLKKGANINDECEHGSALMIAYFYYNETVIDFLLDKNIGVNRAYISGHNIMDIALVNNDIIFGKKLWEYGALANKESNNYIYNTKF